MIPSLS